MSHACAFYFLLLSRFTNIYILKAKVTKTYFKKNDLYALNTVSDFQKYIFNKTELRFSRKYESWTFRRVPNAFV